MRRSLPALLLLAAPVVVSCGDPASEPLAVYDLTPRGGSIAGEQPVQIIGTGFRNDVGYTVYFGSERATAAQVVDPNTLLVVTPAHDAGRVNVVVAADDGPAFRIADGFEFADTSGNVYEHMGEGGGGGEERF
jgi:hypothetical protein